MRGYYTEDGAGSSPLARGLRAVAFLVDGDAGIIPARAGFTRGGGLGRWCVADHPRSRGVYAVKGESSLRPVGSSPLARGLLAGAVPEKAVRGIIPARAGFTDGT